MSALKPITATVAKAKVFAALWTFPAILFSSFMIGWGAEAAQYFISRGLALALLALLQTLPEFAVEAVIAWHQDIHLMLANLTGSLRLLVGFGWPMIYFVRAVFQKKRSLSQRLSSIEIEKEHSVEAVSLLPPLLYFTFIYFKGSLYYYDALVLLIFYLLYLWLVQKMPPKEMEEVNDMPFVPRKVITFSPPIRNFLIVSLFLGGGLILLLTVEPFLESLLAIAMTFGVSQFVFVQWVSPFLSEFPEKLTAFTWAKKEGKASMALMNIVSSNINQWTLLVSMMMMVYSYSKGELSGFPFDDHQKHELALTLIQSFLAFLMLLDLRFRWTEAVILFVLWFAQFIFPNTREEIFWVYFGICVIYLLLILFKKRRIEAFVQFSALFNKIHRNRKKV